MRLSKGGQASGAIKQAADDFLVEEIARNGTVLEIGKELWRGRPWGGRGQYRGQIHKVCAAETRMEYRGGLGAVAHKVERGGKSVGFSGSKDRIAISTQLCSIYGVKPEQLLAAHVKDLAVNGAWLGESKVELGELLGNRFIITVRDARGAEAVPELNQELHGLFPNYYGSQRFGVRDNNFEVGLDIIRGNFEGAVMAFLTDTKNETNQEAVEARKRLLEDQDFKKAIGYFPKYLKYERIVIEYLARYQTDFANAMRRVPRGTTLMFVHAVEGRIFNRMLERRMRELGTEAQQGELVCGADFFGFPDDGRTRAFDGGTYSFVVGNVIGYDTKELSDHETELLEELGIQREDFKVKSMPELNCKGTSRVLFAPYRDFAFKRDEGSFRIGFELPAGAYATVLLSEFLGGQP